MGRVLILVLALPAAAVALGVAMLRRRPLTVGVNEHADVVRIAHRTRAVRAVGLLLGVLAAAALVTVGRDVDALGRLTALAPSAVGAGVLLGTVVGELTARPRVGVRRSAAVETRRLGDLLPRGRTAFLGLVTAVLAALLGLGAAWGSADDLGRPGRVFAVECTQAVARVGQRVGSARGPWPGSFYAVPVGVTMAVLGLLVVLALRAVVTRPRPALESRGLDSVLRRWSVRTVLVAASFSVLATLAPVAALMSAGLADPACGPTMAQTVVRWSCLVLAPLAALGAAASLGALLVTPSVRVDDLPRPSPGDAAPVGAPVR